jgi:hypothetical protein
MLPTVRDKPGLRESIALLRALTSEEVDVLSGEVIDDLDSLRATQMISPTLNLGFCGWKTAQTDDSVMRK